MKYRPEVDGLRALAVVPVMLFHSGVAAFSGGYVGVDVFFVISGYLITSIVVKELEIGSFTVAAFYERRARRILPALTFVIVACAVAGWMLLPPAELVDFSKSVLGVALFSSNVYFKNSGSYFATASESRPLLHTWSLGVEEQFYLFWPLFLLLLWSRARKAIAPLVAVGFAASLALAHWAATNRPSAAFYLLPTRSWELMVGAVIALYLHRRDTARGGDAKGGNQILSSSASLAGLAAIVFSVVAFDNLTAMPGLPALVPTLGTAAVLVFASPGNLAGAVLAARPLVAIGLVSYSAYLWHQPLLAFMRWGAVQTPSESALLLAVSAALPLAWFSWRFVERPFRSRTVVAPRGVAAMAACSTLVFLVFGGVGVASSGLPARFHIADEVLASLAMRTKSSPCMDGESMDTRPDWLCEIGVRDSAPSFLLVGDSHAMALMPAVDSAGRMLGVSGQFVAMSACPPIAGVFRAGRPREVRECHDLNERVMSFVRENRIPLVVMAGRWSAYTDGGYDGRSLRPLSRVADSLASAEQSRDAVDWGLRATVAALDEAGARVILIAQVPEQLIPEPFVLYDRASRRPLGDQQQMLEEYSVSLNDHLRLQATNRASLFGLRQLGLAQVVVLDDAFCSAKACLVGTPTESWYRDHHHLSTVGAHRLTPYFSDLLQGALENEGR